MPTVDFHRMQEEEDKKPVYVIAGCRYRGQWLFVKSRKRGTWEMPAGHVDIGEEPVRAAGRELMEESGARKFTLEFVSGYSVESNNSKMWGSLYYAEIIDKGDVIDVDEIEGTMISDTLPSDLTFPDVQAALFEKLEEHILNRNNNR